MRRSLISRLSLYLSKQFTGSPEPFREVDPPAGFSGSVAAYRRGYNRDYLGNPYRPGTEDYDSWEMGAARRSKEEMGIL